MSKVAMKFINYSW